MGETERLALMNRKRVAKFRKKQAQMAELSTLTIAPMLGWIENPNLKKGDETEITACVVQTPEHNFYRLIAIGSQEELKARFKSENFQAIVHMLPVRIKLVCTEVEG